ILSGRTSVQRELLRLTEDAQENGRSVLMTSSVPPGEWSGIHPMFTSRILAGLSVPLAPPSHLTRTVLIRGWAVLENVPLTDDAIEWFA
ncbi:MAG: DnaA/Hda family protein, partial [Planctomycetia bacterium]|nr:DnaA/Hda family protein [Planctomycetia bacterium]